MNYNLKILDKFKEVFNIFLIFLTSFIFNIYYGSIGVFPIDTFAFFDSANLINKGFLPIRDYWTSNGFFVDILQSFFFKILGVNWYSYLIHSSLINFIFAALTYKFLKSEGLAKSAALFYSLSVAILFYPPVGVPFPDHHSIIFSLISIYFFIFSIKTRSKLYLFITIFSLSIAFLCKQVPAVFFLILIGSYLIYFSFKKKDKSFLIYIFVFSFSLIVAFILFLLITRIGIKDFYIQYISFPSSIGTERSNLFKIQSILLSLINEFKFISIFTLIIFFQLINLKKKNNHEEKNFSATIFLFVSIILIFNQELMKNQNIVFFILPILIGIIHNLIIDSKKEKINFFVLLLIVFNIFVTLKYHERFNENRKFMDFRNINKSNFVDASEITTKLKGLRWITSKYSSRLMYEVDQLKKSITFLKANKERSIIITYYQFINSAIDHNIYPPNRWYTSDGVSYPIKGNKDYENYIKFFKKKLIEKNVNRIYTIDPLDKNTFDFVFKADCVETQKINEILSQHLITNCFAN